jgi:hypothetical protein
MGDTPFKCKVSLTSIIDARQVNVKYSLLFAQTKALGAGLYGFAISKTSHRDVFDG